MTEIVEGMVYTYPEGKGQFWVSVPGNGYFTVFNTKEKPVFNNSLHAHLTSFVDGPFILQGCMKLVHKDQVYSIYPNQDLEKFYNIIRKEN